MGCATPRPRSSSTRWERICGKSRNCSATRISARPCAIPMSAMNRHGRRRKRSVTLWSENAAAGRLIPRTIMTIIVFRPTAPVRSLCTSIILAELARQRRHERRRRQRLRAQRIRVLAKRTGDKCELKGKLRLRPSNGAFRTWICYAGC